MINNEHHIVERSNNIEDAYDAIPEIHWGRLVTAMSLCSAILFGVYWWM